jgi:hypothetical protein
MLHAARPPAAAARAPQTRGRLRSCCGARPATRAAASSAAADAAAAAAARTGAAAGAPRAPPRLILLRHGQAAEEPSLQVCRSAAAAQPRPKGPRARKKRNKN